MASSGQNWRERDSGLSQSLLPGHESADGHGEELENLLEECRTTLGITASQDGPTNTTGVTYCFNLKCLSLHILYIPQV